MANPAQGDIWLADMGKTRGHEQAGKRPVLVISDNIYNRGPAGLVIIVPLTSNSRGIPIHVPVQPPEGGLKSPSVILCDAIRSIAKERLLETWGRISTATMSAVEDRLRILLSL